MGKTRHDKSKPHKGVRLATPIEIPLRTFAFVRIAHMVPTDAQLHTFGTLETQLCVCLLLIERRRSTRSRYT